MTEWKKAGHLVVSTVKYVRENMDKNIPQILIDLRTMDEARKRHIYGAVSIPAKEIATAKDKFPADKKAPIILYASDTKFVVDTFKIVRGWGYTNTSVLEGGIEKWEEAENPVASNALKTEIAYAPKPRHGEIAIEEFKRIVEILPLDKLILDVRDEDEAMQGMLKGSKNIPTQEITSRMSEIPRDKEIIAHCITGVRAEMAYHILKDAGYNVRFLNANIKIDKDGRHEISKE